MTDLRKIAKIETHENVTIEYETANVGTRLMAYIIDQIVMYGSIILLCLGVVLAFREQAVTFVTRLEVDKGLVTALVIILLILFLVQYFYFVFFECVTKGRSPGKALMKLRVISVTGEPETFLMSVVRNFFRIADELPAGNCLGGILVFFSKKSQRLGDKIANTMVVKEANLKKFSKMLDEFIEESEKEEETDDFEAVEAAISESLQEGKEFEAEKELLAEYMLRRDRYRKFEKDEYDMLFVKKYSSKLRETYGYDGFTLKKDQILPMLTALNECSASAEEVNDTFTKYAVPKEEVASVEQVEDVGGEN